MNRNIAEGIIIMLVLKTIIIKATLESKEPASLNSFHHPKNTVLIDALQKWSYYALLLSLVDSYSMPNSINSTSSNHRNFREQHFIIKVALYATIIMVEKLFIIFHQVC